MGPRIQYTFPDRLRDYLKQRQLRSEREQELSSSLRPGSLAKETAYLRTMRRRFEMTQFELMNTVGKGAFSVVYLARDRITGELVAIKVISKSSEKTISAALSERNALVSLITSDFLVKTRACFEDEKFFYIVLEYCPGGDLMGILLRRNVLSEMEAKFYLAEMLEAINDVHNSGFIYLDAKPDNVLIAESGHVKLADFNLVVERQDMERITAGTLDYTAPEVLEGDNYGIAADFWSIGCIIYECTVGRPPFASQANKDSMQKIANFKEYLEIDRLKLSMELKDLLKHMICDADERWGYEQLIKHPFLQGVNFSDLLEIQPPFVPKLASDDDLRYFDMAGIDFQPGEWWGGQGLKKEEYTYKAFPDTVQMRSVRKRKLNEIFE